MLLCRRIHRAHAFNSHRFIQTHGHDVSPSNHTSLVTRKCFPRVTAQPPALSDLRPDSKLVFLFGQVLRVSRYSVPKSAWDSEQAAKQVMSKKIQHCPFDAFMELRAQNSSLSSSLPTEVLCLLAEGAVKYGCQDIVDSITTDVLDIRLLPPEQRAEVATSLLCVPSQYYPTLLDKQTTLSLLAIIRGHDPLFPLPSLAALHAMKTIIYGCASDALNRSLVNFVLGPLIKHVASLEPPMGAKAMSYHPPEMISLAYALVDTFISLKWYREAFDLFQTLADHGHLPAESFQSEVPSPLAHDFAVIVRSTLARACLHWNWHHRGVGLIASIMKSQDSLRQDLEPLTLELLHCALERCRPVQFKACAWLMRYLVDPRCGVAIPTQTVRLFYSQAMRLGDIEAAHTFYEHTQSLRVKRMLDCPLPPSAVLTWLMRYLLERKHNVHLARSLAKQAVNATEPLPVYCRGPFIALAASNGFATEARALWERYSIGGNRALVVGNARTMIRMVSLFAQRDSWARAGMQKNKEDRTVTEFYRFARRVLDAFHMTKLPLEEAKRFDLSALARGYFILGHAVEGLRPFRVLLRRQDIPDQHDMNVALSAVARQSPREASRLVDRMIDDVLRPDGVTFGTVLHEAIVQGDTNLVAEMLERAQAVGVPLSPKTMVALIQARLREGKDRDQLLEDLRWAWGVVCNAEEGSAVHSPNVGKCCIAACLVVEDPVMAFEFWVRLIQGKLEWNDPDQKQQRGAIGDLVRRRCTEGRLDKKSGLAMLRELGEPPI